MSSVGVAKQPCGSCPYRKDVPSGIWERVEYEKLPAYDNDMWQQPQGVFMCHQRDGCLCAGWLVTHGTDELLAMRLHARQIDPAVWTYETDVPCWGSGAEAMAHGIKDIDDPSAEAQRRIAGLQTLLGHY